MNFVRRRAAEGVKIVDPLADRLVETAAACTGDARADVAQFLKLEPVFNRELAGNAVFVAALEKRTQRWPSRPPLAPYRSLRDRFP
jgi:fructuronate reductase